MIIGEHIIYYQNYMMDTCNKGGVQIQYYHAYDMNRTGKVETKHTHIIEMKHSCLIKTKQENRNGSFKHFPVKKIS